VPIEQNDEPAGTAVFLTGPPRHRQRDLGRQRWSRLLSTAGSMAVFLMLPVLAYQVTGASLWTAAAVVAGCLPHLGGPVVRDIVARWADRRRVLVAADAANAAVLASLPVAFALDALTAPHVLGVAFAAQALFVGFDSASAPPASRDRLGRPLFIGGPTRLLAAPVLGAAVLLLTAVRPLVTVDGVSAVVSCLLVRAIVTWSERWSPPQIPPPSLGIGLRRRLAAWSGRKVDQLHLLVCGLHAAGGGAFLGQFVPWADQDLGIAPIRDVRLGLLLGLWAAGAGLATVVLPRAAATLTTGGLLSPDAADRLVRSGVLARAAADRLVHGTVPQPRPRRAGAAGAAVLRAVRRVTDHLGGYRVTLVFLPAAAVCLLLSAVAPHWTVAAVTVAAWGTAYVVVVLDARVAAAGSRMLAYGLGWPAGALAGGLVGAAWGPAAGLATGALLVLAAAAVAWLSPLRTANRAVPATEPVAPV